MLLASSISTTSYFGWCSACGVLVSWGRISPLVHPRCYWWSQVLLSRIILLLNLNGSLERLIQLAWSDGFCRYLLIVSGIISRNLALRQIFLLVSLSLLTIALWALSIIRIWSILITLFTIWILIFHLICGGNYGKYFVFQICCSEYLYFNKNEGNLT